MNDQYFFRIVISFFVILTFIFSYYIGYFSARLGITPIGVPEGSAVAGTNTTNTPPANPEDELIASVEYFDLNGSEVSMGNPNSKIVLVEFNDFECPFCARFNPTVLSLKEKNDLRVVTKHFPLNFHQNAKPYATMFECVAKNIGNDNAYKFAEGIFATVTKNQGQVTEEDGLVVARSLGLTDNQYNDCKNDSNISKKIDDDQKFGLSKGVNGTPALFILNTETKKATRVFGALPEAAVQAEIDKLK
jgi:protein-disulfide isomerase